MTHPEIGVLQIYRAGVVRIVDNAAAFTGKVAELGII